MCIYFRLALGDKDLAQQREREFYTEVKKHKERKRNITKHYRMFFQELLY